MANRINELRVIVNFLLKDNIDLMAIQQIQDSGLIQFRGSDFKYFVEHLGANLNHLAE